MTATTQEYVDQHCMIGSGNSACVPCILDGGYPNDAFFVAEGVRNVGGTDYYLQYTLPLPTSRGGKDLHVNGVAVLIADADTNDYLNMIKIIGIEYYSITSIYNNAGDWKSQQREAIAITAADCSGYDLVAVTLHIVATSADEVNIRGVLLRCYYD